MEFLMHGNHSLKDKRQVLRKIVDGVRNSFNVSVNEVGFHDLYQRAEIGISAVGTDGAAVNSVVDRVVNFIEGLHVVEIIGHDIELINCSSPR
ncbi:MAG: DUF503 domain-containing protein [Deltaproteobacteria bacterium]|nr:DUF503 domain-containing protein [Deltaproteobacteria bacterium]